MVSGPETAAEFKQGRGLHAFTVFFFQGAWKWLCKLNPPDEREGGKEGRGGGEEAIY